MKPYSSVVMPALLALMAAFFFFIALKTLLGRRPLVFSARWFLGWTFFTFLPMFFDPLHLYPTEPHLGMINWLGPAMFGVILCFRWTQMKGYAVVAASDTYFREALLAAAASLGYSFYETPHRWRIRETGEVVLVASGTLKPYNRQSAKLVDQLAHGMKEYFKTNTGKMNYTTFYFYLVMGAFMIAVAGWLSLATHRI